MSYGSVPHPGSGGSYSKGGILSYPAGVGVNAEFPHSIEFTARKRNLSSSNQKASTSLGSVVLYLPADALKTSYSQTFGDADLGAIGAATASIDETAAAGVVNQIDRTLRNVGAGRTDSAIASLSGALAEFKRGAGGVSVGNALAQATVNEALNRPGVGPIKDALFRKAGRIINPHKAVIYQGPGGFRIFNYSFVMSPESQAEAETIAKIVHYFKYYMHPGIPSSDPSKANINSSVTLSYPEEFKITARVKNVSDAGTTGEPMSARVKPLFKIDHCFLESLSVDYSTSGGPVFIVDGITAPATTSLTLQFKETVLMTKEKIREGY
tara:strand:+ start:64 stop:1038 length:975 start_codon:yes stop_codon:yes gene_type:complete